MAYELQSRGCWKWGNHTFRDEHCGPAEGASLMQYVPMPVRLDPSIGFFFLEDFHNFPSTKAAQHEHWAVTEDDGTGGTNAVQDGGGGWYRHYCDGDDEDEAYVHSNHEVFKLQAGKHLWWEARVKLTEVGGTSANFIVGLSENVGADHMRDAGAGPPVNYDGICWYKVDGTMSLSFETSLGAAQVTRAAVLPHVSAHIYRLGAWCFPLTATTFTVYPWYYDETAALAAGPQLGVAVGVPTTLTLTAHGEMEAFFGVKNGAGGEQEEYIEIDYFWVAQQR